MYNTYNECSESYPILRTEIKHEYDCDSQAYGACYRGQTHIPQGSGSIMKLLQDHNNDLYHG